MDSNPTINDVTDTSYWVAYYRAKESLRPDALFHDTLAQKLIGERGKIISDSMSKMSRYTEWSVISRTVLIDRFIAQAIQGGVDAVINLGAGLDTRPYRMNLPASLEWIEVDYPKIIEHKNQTLANVTARCRLVRVPADLSNHEERLTVLRTSAPGAKKVLILTEGVIPYLSQENVRDLSADLLGEKRFAYWITEYFDKRVYKYLQSTVRQAKMKNAPFLFYPDDWLKFFADLGWKPKETRFTTEVAIEYKRLPPMPWYVRLVLPLLPRKMKEESGKMAGYVVFERS